MTLAEIIDFESEAFEDITQVLISTFNLRQRLTPTFWWDYGMQDMPLGVFRSVLKQQFIKNSHIEDIRIIDRLVGETRQSAGQWRERYVWFRAGKWMKNRSIRKSTSTRFGDTARLESQDPGLLNKVSERYASGLLPGAPNFSVFD
ncbi:hypothetical protein COOONC_08520 [Cooperia oncophora]